ncbi:MAG: ABC transporter permease [Anaerolineae bacterium]|nr:ABC transporter permease [Anaerolineae bacterium]
MRTSPQPLTLSQLVWRRFRQHRLAIIGLCVLAAFVLMAIFIPILNNYDALKTNTLNSLKAPSSQNIFGTDNLGFDIWTRLWAGARISLFIGVATMIVAITLGVVVGSIAGYFGGNTDAILMRFTDFMLGIPQLFLLLVFGKLVTAANIAWLVGGPLPIIIVVGTLSWMGVARLVRGQFLSLKGKDFVEATRAMGAGAPRLILRHILPNAASPIIVAATLRVGAAIVTESTLSFLGYGVQVPNVTWGYMLRNAQNDMTLAPWVAVFPGLAIFITVLCINYIGDGLRDALDPRAILKSS